MEFVQMPTLVPTNNATVYLVLEHFGKLGNAWREIDEAEANEAAVIAGILTGEYKHPLRVVAFNTDEGWSRDVTSEVALKLSEAAAREDCSLGSSAREFVERAGNAGEGVREN
jgi:hypothetical protein